MQGITLLLAATANQDNDKALSCITDVLHLAKEQGWPLGVPGKEAA
jgi:hypothetical protein